MNIPKATIDPANNPNVFAIDLDTVIVKIDQNKSQLKQIRVKTDTVTNRIGPALFDTVIPLGFKDNLWRNKQNPFPYRVESFYWNLKS